LANLSRCSTRDGFLQFLTANLIDQIIIKYFNKPAERVNYLIRKSLLNALRKSGLEAFSIAFHENRQALRITPEKTQHR
jgi:hypothetical protein